jgi:glutathione S-transferase
VADRLPTLYQAEWCPFSSAVRELLTELGIDAVVRQVEPAPEERAHLRKVAGTDEIPVLVAEDGQVYRGTREIFAHLRERGQGALAGGHRRQYADHRDARESGATARLLERFRSTDDLEPADL